MILFNILCYILVAALAIVGLTVSVAWCKIAIQCAKEENLISKNLKRDL